MNAFNQLQSGGFLSEQEPDALGVPDASTIEALTRGEVDMQVATAKKYPRALKRFQNDVLTLATMDQETAAQCFYALPRDGKTIEGPSVRLAEIVANAWGNMRCETRIVDIGREFLTAQATVWDLERNLLVRIEVRRRITGKGGRRYSDDMIVVTANAAAAIAFRNAVFKAVPFAYVEPVYEQCRRVAVGDQRTLADNRAQWIGYFAKMGVVEARVLQLLNRASIDEVTVDDLVTLRGLATAIKENTTSIDEVFPDPKQETSAPPKTLDDLVGPPVRDPNEKSEITTKAAGFHARARR